MYYINYKWYSLAAAPFIIDLIFYFRLMTVHTHLQWRALGWACSSILGLSASYALPRSSFGEEPMNNLWQCPVLVVRRNQAWESTRACNVQCDSVHPMCNVLGPSHVSSWPQVSLVSSFSSDTVWAVGCSCIAGVAEPAQGSRTASTQPAPGAGAAAGAAAGSSRPLLRNYPWHLLVRYFLNAQ